jgi:hypothetical protein
MSTRFGGYGGVTFNLKDSFPTPNFDNSATERDNKNRPSRLPVAGVTQLVECNLAKVDVAGSNPVSRSNFPPFSHKRFPRMNTGAI